MTRKIVLNALFVICKLQTFQEISGLSVEPCEGESLIVTLFEIHRSEVNNDISAYFES